MSKTKAPTAACLSPDPRQALAQDIHDQAAEIADEITALLADLPDEQLFGATELLLRDKVLTLVARSLTAKLDQKKTATTARASTVPSAVKPLVSTATGNETP